jgi:hypothetical protein
MNLTMTIMTNRAVRTDRDDNMAFTTEALSERIYFPVCRRNRYALRLQEEASHDGRLCNSV